MLADDIREFFHQCLNSISALEATLFFWSGLGQVRDIAHLARGSDITAAKVCRVLRQLKAKNDDCILP